jgi:hypothetical protein
MVFFAIGFSVVVAVLLAAHVAWTLASRRAERAVKAVGQHARGLLAERDELAREALEKARKVSWGEGYAAAHKSLVEWHRREGKKGAVFSIQDGEGGEVRFRVTEELATANAATLVGEINDAANEEV